MGAGRRAAVQRSRAKKSVVSGLLSSLDEAQERLKTAAIPGQIDIEGKTMTDDPSAVKRSKNPSYIVLRLYEETVIGDEEMAVWVPTPGYDEAGEIRVTQAANRKQAIEAATADSEPDLKAGTFAVVPVEQFQIIPRKVRVEEISEFG